MFFVPEEYLVSRLDGYLDQLHFPAEQGLGSLDARTCDLGLPGRIERCHADGLHGTVCGLLGHITGDRSRNVDAVQSVHVIHRQLHRKQGIAVPDAADPDVQPFAVQRCRAEQEIVLWDVDAVDIDIIHQP